MTMAPVTRLEIPRLGAIEMKPGGYHLMIMNVAKPLKPGEKVTLVFTFVHAGAVTVTADVLAISAATLPRALPASALALAISGCFAP